MRSNWAGFLLTLWAGWLVGPTMCRAQVVQLPSVSQTAYSGSVVIPDGGTIGLGGVRHSSVGAVGRGSGPYAGRAAGGTSLASSMSVTLQVIDLKALDDAILSANVPSGAVSSSALSANSPAAGGGRRVLSTIPQPPLSQRPDLRPAPNDWQIALGGTNIAAPVPESIVESNIRYYLEQGKAAEQAGHLHAARVFYRLALEAMTPEIRQRYQRIIEQRKADEEEKRQQQIKPRVSF